MAVGQATTTSAGNSLDPRSDRQRVQLGRVRRFQTPEMLKTGALLELLKTGVLWCI